MKINKINITKSTVNFFEEKIDENDLEKIRYDIENNDIDKSELKNIIDEKEPENLKKFMISKGVESVVNVSSMILTNIVREILGI